MKDIIDIMIESRNVLDSRITAGLAGQSEVNLWKKTTLKLNNLLQQGDIPKVICLCGSTKFKDAFIEMNKMFTLQGNIVLSVGSFAHSDKDIPQDSEAKRNLDLLHLKKIALADEIFVINVNGYIGSSTENEIKYAMMLNKPITYLFNQDDPI